MVEDNTDVTEVTSALMKQLGYTVRIATDAGKALRMMEEESFDLVFSDIMMPGGMDGLELAKTILKSRPRLPVLLASGSNSWLKKRSSISPRCRSHTRSPISTARSRSCSALAMTPADGNNLVDLSKAKRKRGKIDKQ